MKISLTKEQVIVGAGWIAFMILFWFLGAGKPTMGKATAFFGLVALTAVYAGLVIVAKKILPIGTK